MPKKAANGSSRAPSKTEFILSLPADLAAKEVVARAKAKGFDTTEGQVYSLKSYARQKDAAKKAFRTKLLPVGSKLPEKGASPTAPKTPATAAATVTPQADEKGTAPARDAEVEKQLIGIMVEIGLRQTEAVFDRARARVLEFAKA